MPMPGPVFQRSTAPQHTPVELAHRTSLTRWFPDTSQRNLTVGRVSRESRSSFRAQGRNLAEA